MIRKIKPLNKNSVLLYLTQKEMFEHESSRISRFRSFLDNIFFGFITTVIFKATLYLLVNKFLTVKKQYTQYFLC
jgi:hypothetical protein